MALSSFFDADDFFSPSSFFKGVTGLARMREGKSRMLGDRISGGLLLMMVERGESNPDLGIIVSTKRALSLRLL